MAGFFGSHRERDRENRPPPRPDRPQYLDEDEPPRQPEQHDVRKPSEPEDRRDDDDGAHRRKPKMPGSQAIVRAREYLEALTGKSPEAISGLTPGKQGWKVTLDVVELERIPQTTDVLASYELELDDDGELVNYHRVGRYYRNQVDE
ncbi:MAG TPA: gas vesicle protein [Tepidisphaeraceae bacterium]|nr:gas vesicle protein [Tepidisphaeraceae bacterium]